MAKNIMPAILLSAALLTLAACLSAQEIQQRDEATCRSYGFTPGTSDFATCLQRESLARRYGWGYYGPGFLAGWEGPGVYPGPLYSRY